MNNKVDILLPLYKPDLKYLQELLISLNNQTYNNIELLIYNDCPCDKHNYNDFISKYINKFPFKIYNAQENLGVNGAFEKLTKMSSGKYIAYCDQDDIWLPEKISVMVEYAQKTNADLTVCWMSAIDEKDMEIPNRILKGNTKNINLKNAVMKLLMNGCAMLLTAAFAKNILPFPTIEQEYHDWWIGVNSLLCSGVFVVPEVLMKYRIHYSSSTISIKNKNDYLNKRLVMFYQKIELCRKKFINTKFEKDIEKIYRFANDRILYFKKHNIVNLLKLFRNFKLNPKVVVFESVLPILPINVFKYIMKKLENKDFSK